MANNASITLILYAQSFQTEWKFNSSNMVNVRKIRDKMLKLVDKSRGFWDCFATVDGKKMPFKWKG